MGSTVATRTFSRPISPGRFGLWDRARVAWLLVGLLRRQFLIKYRAHVQEHDGEAGRQSRSPQRESRSRSEWVTLTEPSAAKCSRRPATATLVWILHRPFRKLRAAWGFVRRMSAHNLQLIRVCATALDEAASRGCREVVLYGGAEAARILMTLSRGARVRIRAVCPFGPAPLECTRVEAELWGEDRLAEWNGAILVAAFVNVGRRLERLRELGISEDRLITMRAFDGLPSCPARNAG